MAMGKMARMAGKEVAVKCMGGEKIIFQDC
jgi:hypothetical protein